jgi:hypothetical protein
MGWDQGQQQYYYSGQGVVLMGSRDATGQPAGLLPIGNVSSLKIMMNPSVTEHKESMSGGRAIDNRLQTEMKVTASLDFESLNYVNLRDGLRGTSTQRSAGTVTSEADKLYAGKVITTNYPQISALVVRRGATSLTAYVADGTAWDYKFNGPAGSIQFNDGVSFGDLQSATFTTAGVVATAIVVGATTTVTVPTPATVAVGDMVSVNGFTGADAALVNGKAFPVVGLVAAGAGVILNVNTTGKTITLGTPLVAFDKTALAIDYTYGAHYQVDALTQPQQERWLRFEGLNTSDSNNPVIVDVFRFALDPLKELALIGDAIDKFTIDGNVLLDNLQTSGSKFFRQVQLR